MDETEDSYVVSYIQGNNNEWAELEKPYDGRPAPTVAVVAAVAVVVAAAAVAAAVDRRWIALNVVRRRQLWQQKFDA